MLRVTDSVSMDEPCWWIHEQEETDRELGVAIRTQYICVTRDGEGALFVLVAGMSESMGRKGYPPCLAYGFGAERVGDVLERLNETMDNYKPKLIAPLSITIGGDQDEGTLIPIDHPLMEVLQRGSAIDQSA